MAEKVRRRPTKGKGGFWVEPSVSRRFIQEDEKEKEERKVHYTMKRSS